MEDRPRTVSAGNHGCIYTIRRLADCGHGIGAGNTYLTADAMTMPAKNVTYTAVWDAEECDPEVIFSLEVKASGSDVTLNRGGAILSLTTSNYLSTLTGGTATLKNPNTSSGSDKVITTDVSKYQLYFSSNYISLKLDLNKALAEGDVIAFESSKTNQISFTTTETRSTTPATSSPHGRQFSPCSTSRSKTSIRATPHPMSISTGMHSSIRSICSAVQLHSFPKTVRRASS